MKSINPKQSLPSRATISVAALDDIYTCVKRKFIEKISKSPEHGTVSMDFWSDKHHHTAYVTYTFHFMADWIMHSAVLKTALFDHPHTGPRVKVDFQNTLEEFGLLSKNITAVTDGGSNLIKACNLMSIQRYGCINHAIHNLITTDFLQSEDVGIKPLKELIEKLKLTQYKLTYKHRELQAFEDEQRQQELREIIEQYCETRKFKLNFFLHILMWFLNRTERTFEDEERFELAEDDCDVEWPEKGNTFSGLKKSNSTRWGSMSKMIKSHLKNKGESRTH